MFSQFILLNLIVLVSKHLVVYTEESDLKIEIAKNQHLDLRWEREEERLESEARLCVLCLCVGLSQDRS